MRHTPGRPPVPGAGAVLAACGAVRPLGTAQVQLTGGLLHRWQRRNREATIPHVVQQVRAAGNLDNLRAAAGGGAYRGRYPFLDTDVYKTCEGLAYELARGGADLAAEEFFEEAVATITAAQAPNGYLSSRHQHPDSGTAPFEDLAWGHELYNLGHLIQAAVAARRQLGDDRLLRVATRFADLVVDTFGPAGRKAVCGHPEVEMALVELFRETGERAYLRQAGLFVDRRGHGLVHHSLFPPSYFQDHAPLRELPTVTGHAVRMTYLAAGAADVYLEGGDPTLLAALRRLWQDMADTKLHLTGGLGSRHSDEAIGDRYELTPDRSYSETCAAIGTMQWAWRMFLAEADFGHLDLFERVLYNAFAVGLSDDGTRFFYDNPLQRRPDHDQRSGAETGGEALRRPWFGCACCPPNVVRWMAQLQDYVCARREGELLIGLYAPARITTDDVTLSTTTDYPWDGRVDVTVERAAERPLTLTFRVPAWTRGTAGLTVNGEPVEGGRTSGAVSVRRRWRGGDTVRLDLPMPVRAHTSHPHVDATRGCLAFVRGPLVYCVEQQDCTADVDDLVADHTAPVRTVRGPLLPGGDPATVALELTAQAAGQPTGGLYPEAAASPAPRPTPARARLIPYHLWGNRDASAMRVWIRQV